MFAQKQRCRILLANYNSWIGEGVWIDNLTPVKVGNKVCISQGAMLLTGNHDYSVIEFDLLVKPIIGRMAFGLALSLL